MWFRFLWQTKFIFTILCSDCFTLHENPSLSDLLPGFKVLERLKRKENSLKTIYLFLWITLIVSVATFHKSHRCSGILTWSPFAFLFPWCLTYHLGSTHPYSITVCMEPFSTSVFKFYPFKKKELLLSLWFSHLNNCYYYQDLYWSPFHTKSLLYFHMMITSFYSWEPPLSFKFSWRKQKMFSTASPSPQFQRHPFSGLIHSVGELLRTP